MITVVARRDRNWVNEYDMAWIAITKDGVTLELDQEECQHLFSVLKGKEGIAQSTLTEGETQPKTIYVHTKKS
jgi:hypothetical protein